MKEIPVLLILSILIISGCAEERTLCGDGVCDEFEREHNACPQDCDQVGESEDHQYAEGILYIGMMIHLEGWDNEVNNRDQFARHAQAARDLATLFEAHGARATFEARPEFVQACEIWNDPVLTELYERGHGIGVHADVGGSVEKEGLTQEVFSHLIASMKEDMESATGIDIIHISGICSTLDWVSAAADAGYSCVSGCVGYCAMSLPPQDRPVIYRSCKNPAACHGVIPLTLQERLHPWRTNTARNWLNPDPSGKIVILPSNGGLYYLEEEAQATKSPLESGTFTREDISAYVDLLDEALHYTEKDIVTIFYVALSVGSPHLEESLYQDWFAAIQPYIDSGRVQWKTLPEMCRLVITQEASTDQHHIICTFYAA